ncbi:MAG: hypothetical protein U1F43_14445 [Myxococcota bacterium]
MGDFKNGGQEWRPPRPVRQTSHATRLSDVDETRLNVGTTHAEFASNRRWTAMNLSERALQQTAGKRDSLGRTADVAIGPASIASATFLGHEQVDKIEHRLFSHIAMNWRGRPRIDWDRLSSVAQRVELDFGRRTRLRRYPTSQSPDDIMSK